MHNLILLQKHKLLTLTGVALALQIAQAILITRAWGKYIVLLPPQIIIATGLADGGVELNYSPNWGNTNPIYTIGMYQSMDYGATWQQINNGFIIDFYNHGGCVRKLEIDPNNPNIVFAATSNGIYRTENAFSSSPVWVNVYDGPPNNPMDFRSIKFNPGNSSILYAGGQDIFKSIDGGNTWYSMTGANTGLDFNSLLPFEPHRINLAVTPANNNRLFAYIWGISPGASNAEKYIYYFENGNWNQLYHNTGYNSKEWIALAVSPTNADAYFFYDYGVKGSTTLSTPTSFAGYIGNGYYADGHVLEFPLEDPSSNPSIFYGHHAGFSVGSISSSSASWQFKNNGLQNMLHWGFDDSEFESDLIVSANQDCYHYVFKDNDWQYIGFGGGDSYTARSSGVNKDIFFLSNGGASLRAYNIQTGGYVTENNVRPYDGENPNNLCCIPKTCQVKTFPNDNSDYFSFSEIYKRNFDQSAGHNSNDLWDIDSDIGKTEPTDWKRQITEFDFCYTNPDYIYLSTGGSFSEYGGSLHFEPMLFKTTTGGNNGNYNGINGYTQLSYPGSIGGDFPIISGIAVHPTNPNKVWISLIGYDNISMRIAFSSDGGTTWSNADPNNSLPQLPVNGVVYQYGSSDALYIATDVGVYYKDASMSNWEEYGEFPHVRVMELDINYCESKLRAATYGRTLWEGDLLPSTNEISYTIKTGENITWANSMALLSSLTIQSNATLTVQGLVNMPEDSKITIKKGGKLIIDGATITNGCGHLWQGIYIEGDPTATAAPPPYQGMLTATNGTIENAVCAITVGCAPSGDIESGEGVGIPTGCGGGIVQCTGTQFINNKRSVKFDAYDFDNVSYFKTCTFKADNNYLATAAGNTRPDDFIKLSNVKNVRFIASDFESNIGTGSEVKYGIYAQNSSFSVKEYSNTPSTFSNLSYGVYSLTSTGTLGQTIQDSEFDMCEKGIYISGSTGAKVLSNTFNIPNAATSYGLYLDGCTGYHIENNSFAGTGENASAVGCYVNNSGEDNNEIYRNYFEDLEVALVSLGENTDGASNGDGLCFVCNEFTDCSTDIKVTDICVGCPSGAIAGIRNVQSDIDNQAESAANKFLTGILGHIDFYNDGADISYIFNSMNAAIEEPTQLGGDNFIDPNYGVQNSCPSKLTGGGGSGEGADSDAPNSSVNTMWQTNNLRIDGNSSYIEPLIYASSSNKKSEESNLNSDEELVVLPNPNSGAFTITLPDNSGVLEVVNMQGISVYKAPVDQQTIKLNLDHLSTGIYFVRYNYGDNMENRKTTKLQIVK